MGLLLVPTEIPTTTPVVETPTTPPRGEDIYAKAQRMIAAQQTAAQEAPAAAPMTTPVAPVVEAGLVTTPAEASTMVTSTDEDGTTTKPATDKAQQQRRHQHRNRGKGHRPHHQRKYVARNPDHAQKNPSTPSSEDSGNKGTE